MILDAGPETVAALAKVFAGCKHADLERAAWAPSRLSPSMRPPMPRRSRRRQLTRAGKLVSVAGGGDTVAALNKAGAAQDFTFISTAGGAFLEWMEGKDSARCCGVDADEAHGIWALVTGASKGWGGNSPSGGEVGMDL